MRTPRGLSPYDEAAQRALKSVKIGTVLRADLTVPRNLKHHRKFFALLQCVWQATDKWPTVDDLLTELKMELGVTKTVVLHSTGEVVKVPGSISFASMDQAEFDEFYERALRALCEIAGGIEHDALRNEVLNQLEDRR